MGEGGIDWVDLAGCCEYGDGLFFIKYGEFIEYWAVEYKDTDITTH